MSEEALVAARMIVSELATNAYLHGTGRITLRLVLVRHLLRIEVVDEGTGNAPAIREQGANDTGGFGLRIVDQLSTAWGAHEGTTHVWALAPLR